jgi:membrane protein required for beta-lactamase induction
MYIRSRIRSFTHWATSSTSRTHDIMHKLSNLAQFSTVKPIIAVTAAMHITIATVAALASVHYMSSLTCILLTCCHVRCLVCLRCTAYVSAPHRTSSSQIHAMLHISPRQNNFKHTRFNVTPIKHMYALSKCQLPTLKAATPHIGTCGY